MNQYDFDIVLQKYLSGEQSPEEEKFVLEYLENNPLNDSPVFESEKEIIGERIKRKLYTDIVGLPVYVRFLPWIKGIAASIAIVLGCWFFLDKTASTETLNPETVDGQSVVEIKNTSNKPQRVALEDGSIVILKAKSSISFPEHFGEKRRLVYLHGEAFFEISKDPERPFLVYSNGLVTKVLGTSFTIKAYDSAREVMVEVKTGRVSVFAQSDPDLNEKLSRRELEGMILSPNQKIIYERDGIRMVKTLVEKPQIILPKSQIPQFEFEDTPANEAFESIAKSYGIDILYDEELLSGCPLTATLDNQSLHEKLSIICKAVEASYEILDGQIIIHSKGCRN